MKKYTLIAALVAMTYTASATVYNDSQGDTFFGGHMDILSVEILNDLNDITFSITVAANNPGWGNYLVAIDTAVGGSNSNAWSRPIAHNGNPIEYWAGNWSDFGTGANFSSYNGATWDGGTAPGYSFNTSNVTFTIALADLGLSPSDTFNFDIYSTGTGNGDGPLDSLADPNQTIAGWSDPYESQGMLQYTVVPEPATLSLLAIGGIALAIRRRRRV